MATGSARGTWQDGTRRALEYAVAASLVLHAVALLSLPALPSPPPRPPVERPLEARLMPLPSPRPPAPAPAAKPPPVPLLKPPPPPVPRPAPRREVKKARSVPKRIHRRILKPVQAPSRVHEPPPPPAPPPAVSPPTSPPAPPPPVVAAPRAPAPARAPVPSRAQAVPDTASLVAQYRAEIIALAGRYKRYPRFARDNGWEGKVEVNLAIGADGAIASLRVSQGSGFSILDRQALEMVRRAEPQARIPAGLRGKAFDINVPVIFSLRDPGG